MPVPAAAGGGRDGHTHIEVLEIVPALDGEREIALRLARAVAVGNPRPRAELSAAAAPAGSTASGLPEWFCEKFPRMCD
ncbi:hypothetical protein [uncultured Serinicoccus sp.]|uniref:hypothetical protein n=1 Tax=uncultured Serinicoccus sp. TaxID=735514 RepID=UPI00260DA2CB|nr:hypothetical protein [uncultured Serinicoccus sp.]